ncbi:MAG TPA: segregation/condensation protein A [Deltaproteobacteria bacterium]|nr:segregation/condensation protein A [Deltaproteobacteria bacterium]
MIHEQGREFILHLSSFEGPLDLLLYLIEKNRFTLENLEVCPIIDQYLRHIETLRRLDVSLAGEFLDMASYLIWLKSCLLLPVNALESEEGEFNPARELQEMLMAYRAIKQASRDLSSRPLLFRDRFPKGSGAEQNDVAFMGMGSLMQAINAIRARTQKYVMNVAAIRFSIQDMMKRIQTLLKGKQRVSLDEVIQKGDRMETIGALLAGLELSKSSFARLIQRGLFSMIYIVRR